MGLIAFSFPTSFRPVRFNLNLPMQFTEPEALLAEPRRQKSASVSGWGVKSLLLWGKMLCATFLP